MRGSYTQRMPIAFERVTYNDEMWIGYQERLLAAAESDEEREQLREQFREAEAARLYQPG